jgi:hypothetical protein
MKYTHRLADHNKVLVSNHTPSSRKAQMGFLTVFCQFIVKSYHSSVLPRCQYPNDEDLNICLESGANKLAFGRHQVRVSRT